jgi:uncharacterized protein YjiS (DUF1127 family)
MFESCTLSIKSAGINLVKCKWIFHRYTLFWLSRIKKWHQNAKTRRELADLPSHRYWDIGLTQQQVQDEIKKKFWQ